MILKRVHPLGAISGVAGTLLLLVAYCQAQGLDGAGSVPIDVSFKWSLEITFWWAASAALWWLCRAPLIDLIQRKRAQTLFAAAGFLFFLMQTAALIAFLVQASASATPIALGGIRLRLLDLAPGSALASALAIAVYLLVNADGEVRPAKAEAELEWLPLPEEAQLALRKTDVPLVRSAGNYCELHAFGRVYLVRVTLKTLASRLAPFGFVQVHRTALVNVAHVRYITPSDNGSRMIIHQEGGLSVPVGRSFEERVRRFASGKASRRSPGEQEDENKLEKRLARGIGAR